MLWHAQITSLTLRALAEPGGYERKDPFLAVAQVELLGDGEAFVHAALRADGKPISRQQWRCMAQLLRDEFGVMTIHAERRGRRVTFDSVRA